MGIRRRQFIQGLSALPLVSVAGFPGLSLASTPGDKRFVFLLLRGGMDGLAVVPAMGDPNHERARNGIATTDPLKLDALFGMHPLLPELKKIYDAGDLAVVHAVASSYRERSHFDGQNLLENGSGIPYGLPSGWLNRALLGLQRDGEKGIAVTSTMPVAMRGDAPISSWSPSVLPDPDPDTINRLANLYASKPAFADAFEKARMANASMDMAGGSGGGQFPTLMRAAARFIKAETGPRVAFVEQGGWDTHAGQMGIQGPLYRNLVSLNEGVQAFRDEIGAAWQDTAVIAVTEFGRTVAMNGSNGTDHGTASAALLFGGAVNGGKVYADWPGLRPRDQYEGRDLKPTVEMRSLFKSLLITHLGIAEGHVEGVVFPDSGNVGLYEGIV